MKIHYLTFDFDLGFKVTGNVAQYPLIYVTYLCTKFEVAYVLGFSRRYIYKKQTEKRTDGRTDGWTDDGPTWYEINIPLFSKEKSGYNYA